MIDELHAENLVLIKEAELRPAAGLTVLSGETGAGKTALLNACRLVMGQRADKTLVREGQKEASCEIRIFDRRETDEGEAQIVARRTLTAEGRSRCRIDGHMANVSELAETISPYIDLCSQHDQQLLASTSTQRALLDSWSGVDENGLKERYEQAYARYRQKERELSEVIEASKSSDGRLQDAKLVHSRIASLGPSDEDHMQISSSLKKAENAEVLARTTSEAKSALEDEGEALDCLNGAVALLEEGGRCDPALAELAQALREAVYVAEDVSREISSYSSAIEFDAGQLERMQERMSEYQSVLRAYGPTLDDVYKTDIEAVKVIDANENADKAIQDAKRDLEEAKDSLAAAARELSQARMDAAPQLTARANEVLEGLNMPGASILFQLKALPSSGWTEDGADDVRMMFVPAQGMQPRELSRIASGGELSRVMLAVRAAIGERDNVETLIFDEIDAGVGGESALALADVIGQLAMTHQVIAVSHLPQIAAKADSHYLVEKTEEGGSAVTRIRRIEGDERVHEVARMLSGSITDASLTHARELLARD